MEGFTIDPHKAGATGPHADHGRTLREFREEARTWLEENIPCEQRPRTTGPEVRDYDADWQRRQFDGGWAGIGWPREYGGRGLSPRQQLIWYEELVRARAPDAGVFGVAIGHAGPTLMLHGSEEQKARYLPRILTGDTPWCQGFSEPGAGSDLAGLRCRAIVDGDMLVVSGQKIWTSSAQWSDYCELLVRTDDTGSKHQGISWVIMDMHSDGVNVRPIIDISGFPHNCEVFFDEVRVPLANVVGEVNHGWAVAMSTLTAERGLGFLDQRLALIGIVDDLLAYARQSGQLGDDAIADRLARARALATAVRSMAYHQVAAAEAGLALGPEAATIRTYFIDLQTTVARLAVDVLGVNALGWEPWTRYWLEKFSGPISSGTRDIQRNVIGERLLGLPR